jgi:hypothetical protein
MNTAQRILLFITFFLVIQACSEVSQSESSDIRLPSLTANLFVEPTDSTIPQKLPLLSGTWKGIGKDQARAFTWMVTNDQLEGNYQANKKIKEDYSKMFRFGFRMEYCAVSQAIMAVSVAHPMGYTALLRKPIQVILLKQNDIH